MRRRTRAETSLSLSLLPLLPSRKHRNLLSLSIMSNNVKSHRLMIDSECTAREVRAVVIISRRKSIHKSNDLLHRCSRALFQLNSLEMSSTCTNASFHISRQCQKHSWATLRDAADGCSRLEAHHTGQHIALFNYNGLMPRQSSEEACPSARNKGMPSMVLGEKDVSAR